MGETVVGVIGQEQILEAAEGLPPDTKLVVYLLIASNLGTVMISATVIKALWSALREERKVYTDLVLESRKRLSERLLERP